MSTNVDTNTVFSYTPGGGQGINLVIFLGQGNKKFYIFTPENSVGMSNLIAYGTDIGKGVTYNWNVFKTITYSNIDELVSSPLEWNPILDGETGSMWMSFTTKQ